jgi:DNA excision repair protein ERCC-4
MEASMARLPVQADHREGNATTFELLRASLEFDLALTHLKLGDYLVDGRLLFERKTLTDFVQAIVSGRLFTQAARLSTSTLHAAIILEGTSRDLADCGMRWEAIQGALITVTLCYGIPVLRTRVPEETVRTMLFAARQTRRLAAGALPRPGYRPRGRHARQLFILQGFPGVGPERARRLLRRFGSIRAIAEADADELRAVEGIGEQVAAVLQSYLEQPRAEYDHGSAAAASPRLPIASGASCTEPFGQHDP